MNIPKQKNKYSRLNLKRESIRYERIATKEVKKENRNMCVHNRVHWEKELKRIMEIPSFA